VSLQIHSVVCRIGAPVCGGFIFRFAEYQSRFLKYLVAEALFLHGASFRGESMLLFVCVLLWLWVCVRFA
jgi:hypothetical protein